MRRPNDPPQRPKARSRDLLVAFLCGGFVALMVGVSYAAVPLYSWFCRTTGFGGTTQVAGLPWSFEPERRTIDVRLGQVVTVYYKVANQAARAATVGQAGCNVSPPAVGIYLEKINCFCFTTQTMHPRETRDMAVVFYVDPKLADDSEQGRVSTITLSYTFHPAREPEAPVNESAVLGKSGGI
jgi:cytochrome c oxidase assembly protein subunit 11